MKFFFNQNYRSAEMPEEDFTAPSLRDDIEKTRKALEIAYAGFDNAVDNDMIDCYIYEINSLLKRYKHLNELAAMEPHSAPEALYQKSPIRTLVSQVLG